MHPSALSNALRFRQAYCAGRHALRIVEVGAQDVNGSLRNVFEGLGDYVGVDFVRGPGVDVVLDDPYRLPFPDQSIDVLLCSSVLEHSQFFWLLFLEMLRILRPTGLLYLNAPSNGSFHRYPVDCWRFYPDSGDALVAWAQRSGYQPHLLESYVSDQERAEWNDCVSVFVRDAACAEAYPKRILDTLQAFRNGRLAGREDFLKFTTRTEDQERAAPARSPAAASKAPEPASAATPAARVRMGGGERGAPVKRWALESPAALKGDEALALISGWVLPAEPDCDVRLVARSGHRTACWPLNVQRPDVVAAFAKPGDAEPPPLLCGFKRRFKAGERLQIGFEVDGIVQWVDTLARKSGAAPSSS